MRGLTLKIANSSDFQVNPSYITLTHQSIMFTGGKPGL